nr:hypothetical protein [uncultured Campylobacter sp.]
MIFSGCGSGWIKFEAEIYKFYFKFERKTNKVQYFFFRRGGNDGGEGADWSSVTEADRVSNEI